MENLPVDFEKIIRNEIENEVLPNFESMVLNHFPNLNATYKPDDKFLFLFAYVIGVLEDAYHKVYLAEGFGEYSDEEYFSIHRLISEYKDQINVKINEYLQSH